MTVNVFDNAGAASDPVSTQITVEDPLDTISGVLMPAVDATLAAGVINEGVWNSLTVQLEASLASLALGNTEAAAGTLLAFAYHGMAIIDPAASLAPCFDIALEMAEAVGPNS